MAIISYDRRPDASIDEKLNTLIDSIMLAFNEYDRQTESNTEDLSEHGFAVKDGQTEIAKYGNEMQVGALNSSHSVIDTNGLRVYASDGSTELACIGYGEVGDVTGYAPVYRFNGGILAGGLPSGLLVETVELVDDWTVEHANYNNSSHSVAKDGYVPLGIVGMRMQNATNSGQYVTWVFLQTFYISGTTAYFTVRNSHASTDAKIKITGSILYAKT